MLAIFSGWFHSTLSEVGQTVDIIGVYATLLALLAYGFIEMVPLRYDNAKSYIIMLGAIFVGIIGGYSRTKIRFFDSDYFIPFLVFILIVYMVVGGLRARDGAVQHVAGNDGLLLPMSIAIIAALIAVCSSLAMVMIMFSWLDTPAICQNASMARTLSFRVMPHGTFSRPLCSGGYSSSFGHCSLDPILRSHGAPSAGDRDGGEALVQEERQVAGRQCRASC